MRRSGALVLAAAVAALLSAWPAGAPRAGAQSRNQVTIGIGAEPLTLLGSTVVDWTTNAQLENVYDLLFTRDAKTEKILPWLATGYRT